MTFMRDREKRYELLDKRISSYESALIALSGGTDSTLLSFLAQRLIPKSISATAVSPFFPERERRAVEDFTERCGIDHRFVRADLPDEIMLANRLDRCYLCKKRMFERLTGEARGIGISNVLDGTTASDLSEDRPGLRALKELGVISPFAEAGITGRDVVILMERSGLKRFIRPSNTCLATRIPSETAITTGILRMIERAEEKLYSHGFHIVRVRYREPGHARIEVGRDEVRKLEDASLRVVIIADLRTMGFRDVSFDAYGYKPAGYR